MRKSLVLAAAASCVLAVLLVSHGRPDTGAAVDFRGVPAPIECLPGLQRCQAQATSAPPPSTPPSPPPSPTQPVDDRPPWKNVGTLPSAQCFKNTNPIPDVTEVQKLRGTFWEGYLQFGAKWTALPFCPPKPYRTKNTSLPSVAICATIAANEHPFVREWAMHHLLLGVRAINIYPANAEQRRLLKEALGGLAREGGPVWLNPDAANVSLEWLSQGGNHVSAEKRNIAHCFRERITPYDVVLHIDLDEYMFPGVYPNVPAIFAAELGPERDEVAFCVRYMGYGPNPPMAFPNNTLFLKQVNTSSSFCTNSKTGGRTRCVKKPKVKVRKHFVHELPICCGCRGDGAMIGTYLKKVPPSPCCRPSYFVVHMQNRDYHLDSVVRRRRETAGGLALRNYREFHAAAFVTDTRMRAFGEAVEKALGAGCFERDESMQCPIPVPLVKELL